MGLNFFTKKPTTAKFFAIEINQQSVKTAIWMEKADQQIEVLKVSEAIAITDQSQESILQSLDMSISSIEDSRQLVDKVIFGLEATWVDSDGGIKSDRRKLLKYLCDNLKLTPLGFVVTFDSILNFIAQKQAEPLSAIFCQIFTDNLVFSLVRLGKLAGTQTLRRTDNIASDFTNAFKLFVKHGSLPTQIYLFDSNLDFATIKQQLSQEFNASSSFFTTIPQFESFPSEFTVKATAIIGGQELIRNQRKRIEEASSTISSDINLSSSASSEITAQDEPDYTTSSIPALDMPQDFVIGQDIDAPVAKASFLSKIFAKKPKPIIETEVETKTETSPEDIGKTSDFLEPEDLPKSKKTKTWLYFALIGALLSGALLSIFLFYQSRVQADIVLAIHSDPIEATLDIKASSEIETVDFTNLIVPAANEVITVEGSTTIPTTGTIQIGDKAKGKVTIYNKTTSERSFSKGKILISSNNLRFLLSDDITIASSSATGEGLTFGKTEANIEASSLGPNYNLADSTEFSLKDLSTDQFSAKAVGEISGGSSQDKLAVDKKDLTSLTQLLTDQLVEEAKKELSTKLGSEIFILEDTGKTKLIDPIFNGQAGDTAETLTLTASLELETLVAKETDFRQITSKALKDNLSQNYSPNLINFQTEILGIESTEDIITVKVKTSAAVKPKIDLASLKLELIGQNLTHAENRLKNQPNYENSQITFTPSLAQKLGKLPSKPEKINITLTD